MIIVKTLIKTSYVAMFVTRGYANMYLTIQSFSKNKIQVTFQLLKEEHKCLIEKYSSDSVIYINSNLPCINCGNENVSEQQISMHAANIVCECGYSAPPDVWNNRQEKLPYPACSLCKGSTDNHEDSCQTQRNRP